MSGNNSVFGFQELCYFSSQGKLAECTEVQF